MTATELGHQHRAGAEDRRTDEAHMVNDRFYRDIEQHLGIRTAD